MPSPTAPPGEPAPGGGGSTKPPATTTYDPPALAIGRSAVGTLCVRDTGEPLPNLRLLSRERHEFAPWTARLRYAFDQTGTASPLDPTRLEHCFGLAARGARVAKVDDRIRVLRMVGTRAVGLLFDGFVVAGQGDLGPDHEGMAVTLAATPIREQDTPLPGAVYRDGHGVDDIPGDGSDPAEPQDTYTDLPTRFNPDGKGNATGEDGDSLIEGRDGGPDYEYPVFCDPGRSGSRQWTLEMAVRYCLCVGNEAQSYVKLHKLSGLADLLTTIRPAESGGAVDLTKPDTFTREPIVVRDIDVTGMTYPDAIRRLIEPHGFAFRYDLTARAEDGPAEDEDGPIPESSRAKAGDPEWRMVFYRKDDTSLAKSAYLQAPGAELIAGKSNVNNLSIVRDVAGVQNQWRVVSKPDIYEASLIVESAYESVDPADLATPGLYVKSRGGTPAFDPIAYRRFVVDEDGSGHWDTLTESWMAGVPTPLDAIFGTGTDIFADDGDEGGGSIYQSGPSPGSDVRIYAHRRREVIRNLVTKDSEGQPRPAELWVSPDYGGPIGVWDRSLPAVGDGPAGGTWVRVSKGGFEWLDDRLGFDVTTNDPRSWPVADPGTEGLTGPLAGGSLNLVQAVIAGSVAFRITVAFEGDRGIDALADRRAASPTRFVVERFEDARDRFGRKVIAECSHLNPGSPTPTETIPEADDDTEAALAQAESRRHSNEAGVFSGSFSVPYFTDAYGPGDKIPGVVGRDLSFRMNAAEEDGESPRYPVVIGVTDDFEGGQGTSVTLQDYRAEVPPERRGRRRA